MTMVEKRTWAEFREIGLLWWVNRTLHLFGWVIAIEFDEAGKEITNCYPARTKFRGFEHEAEEDGFIKLSKYLNKNSQQLENEAKN